MTAAAAVPGHVAPFWNGFSGGKGFASYIGLMLATNPAMGAGVLACGLLGAAASDYIVAGTCACAAAFPICLLVAGGPAPAVASAAAASALLVARHVPNFKAMAAGTEPGIRSVLGRGRKTKDRK